jgi:hypothetical protein
MDEFPMVSAPQSFTTSAEALFSIWIVLPTGIVTLVHIALILSLGVVYIRLDQNLVRLCLEEWGCSVGL